MTAFISRTVINIDIELRDDAYRDLIADLLVCNVANREARGVSDASCDSSNHAPAQLSLAAFTSAETAHMSPLK